MEECLQKFLEKHPEIEKVFWDYYKDEVWGCAESYGFDTEDEDFCDQWGQYDDPSDWYDDHAHSTGYGAAYGTGEGILFYIKETFPDTEYDPHDEENQVLVCEFFGVRTNW